MMSEIDKMLEAREKGSQAIGEFIEWLLNEKGCEICYHSEDRATDEWNEQFDEPEGFAARGAWIPIGQTIEQLLAEHFNIDLHALEAEKRQVLDAIREEGQSSG
jgi:hypothetical protein